MTVAEDVVIVGAGPSGLALACALADSHFRVAVIEQRPRTAIAAPAADDRKIALTHRAIAILKSLGLWQRLAPESISPIRAAHVFDGQSPQALGFDPGGSGLDALGYLVRNHLIRKAAYEALAERPSIRLLDGTQIEQLQRDTDPVRVGLAGGTELRRRLLVAADSRFSGARRQMGISAEHRDFGRRVIVCRLAHEAPANGIAYEFFGYGRTLAILPLNGHQVSAVITVTGDQADALVRLPPEAFAASIRAQFPRLGALRISGERPMPIRWWPPARLLRGAAHRRSPAAAEKRHHPAADRQAHLAFPALPSCTLRTNVRRDRWRRDDPMRANSTVNAQLGRSKRMPCLGVIRSEAPPARSATCGAQERSLRQPATPGTAR